MELQALTQAAEVSSVLRWCKPDLSPEEPSEETRILITEPSSSPASASSNTPDQAVASMEPAA